MMKVNIDLMTKQELQKIHDYTFKVLENPGMKIMNTQMLDALEAKGAKVNKEAQVVQFTPVIIEEAIEMIKKDYKEGRAPKYMNGVTNSNSGQGIKAKFGGACVQKLDWANQTYRDPLESDLIDMIKLGEAIPEVAIVGNPYVYLKDDEGNPIDPRMQRVKTASVVAKYTTKPGPTEVWNAKELKFLIEIGTVVKGSKEAYFEDPCFITAKETIAPLILEDLSAETLIILAQNNLPCTIIPMPISGVSTPVTLMSNIIICNAEILGTMAALKAVVPEARCVGGVISGSMDMKTGLASFGAAEAGLQDLGIAEVHEKLYGFDFGLGSGYYDGKYPNTQHSMEKTLKYFIAAATGKVNFPVGLINSGKCFSGEQAVIDIENLHLIDRFLEGFAVSEENAALDIIREVGIGGSFLTNNHTLTNYAKNLYVPEIMDRTLPSSIKEDLKKDMVLQAQAKVEKILAREDLYEIESDKAKEIDLIVKATEKELL
jgi:trimethylamine---corrinoid protein Co-methyltransferase